MPGFDWETSRIMSTYATHSVTTTSLNSHTLENTVKLPKSHDLKLPFYNFATMFSKLQMPRVKYLLELLIGCKSIEFFPKKYYIHFDVFCQDKKSFVPFEYNPCNGPAKWCRYFWRIL